MAAVGGHLGVVVEMLTNKDVKVNQGTKDNGSTPLLGAIQNGHLEVTKALMNDARTDINQGRTDDGSTPLYFAAEYRRPEIVRMMLKYKNIDVNKSNTLNQGPLHIASENNDKTIVKLLLKHPDINATAKAVSMSNSKMEFDALYASRNNKKVNKQIKKSIKHRCYVCHKKSNLKCGRCKKYFYCNKDCQRKHWKKHKVECKKIQN